MSQFCTTNEQLADLMAKVSSPKLVPWCFIDPLEADAPKQCEYWLTKGGMKGVKMYPPMGWYPNDPRAMAVFDVIAAHDVPVLLHMGAWPHIRNCGQSMAARCAWRKWGWRIRTSS